MDDLRSRLDNRVKITTGRLQGVSWVVEGAFGGDVDYVMLIKLYGESADKGGQRRYSPADCTRRRLKEIPI